MRDKLAYPIIEPGSWVMGGRCCSRSSSEPNTSPRSRLPGKYASTGTQSGRQRQRGSVRSRVWAAEADQLAAWLALIGAGSGIAGEWASPGPR